MNYDFLVEEHEEYGMLGLAAMFMEGAEPLGGLTAAHDVMEHFPCKLDSDGEALALGAMLYIRGEGGYFNGNAIYRNPGRVLESDIARLWTDAWKWGDISDPGKTQPLEEHVEEWIEDAVCMGLSELKLDHEEEPSEEWGEWVRGWLRKGYRKARQRYSLDPNTLTHVFRRMQDELQHSLERSEEGAIVRVSFVRKTGELHVYTIERWEREHPDYEPWEE